MKIESIKERLFELKKGENVLYFHLFIIGLFLIWLRTAYLFIVPYMYTEDATWLSLIIQKGFFYSLFEAKETYFIFGNIILLQISLAINRILFGFNVIYLPIIVAFVQYVFYALVAVLPVICFKNILKRTARLFIWLFIILLPVGAYSFEIFGKISNVGFLFYFIAFCILCWRHFNGDSVERHKLFLGDAVILLCCLTNPACYVLLGFMFLVELYYEIRHLDVRTIFKDIPMFLNSIFRKYKFVSLAISTSLAVLFAIITKVILTNIDLYRDTEIIKSAAIVKYFARSFLYNTLYPIYESLTDIKVILLLIVLFAGISILFFFSCNLHRRMIIISLVSMLILFVITMLYRPSLVNFLTNYESSFPDRYFYVLNVMMLVVVGTCISALLNMRNTSWLGYSIVFIYIGVLIVNGGYIFEVSQPHYEVTKISFEERIIDSFRKESIIRDGTGINYVVDVELEHQGWKFIVPEKYVLSSIEKVRNSKIKNFDASQDISVLNYTDENWTSGIRNDGSGVLLFENTGINRILLDNAKSLISQGVVINVIEVKEVSSQYINVVCSDGVDLSVFAYPNSIEVKR